MGHGRLSSDAYVPSDLDESASFEPHASTRAVAGQPARERFARPLLALNLALATLLASALAVWLYALLRAPAADRFVDLLADDAYYYLTVASNIVESGRSSFDGLTSTNGYQPLWLWCIVALAKLVGVGSWRLFVALCMLVYALALGPLLVGNYLGLKRPSSVEASACLAGLAFILLTSSRDIFLGGMETVLFVPLAVPLVLAIEQRKDSLTAALLSIAVFVRLDALALLPSFCAVAWLPFNRRGGSGKAWCLRCIRVCAPACALFAVYLGINQLVFASAVPVSGLAKSLDGARFHNFGSAFRHVDELKQIFPVAVLLGGLEWVRRRGKAPAVGSRSFGQQALLVFAGSCALQFFYYGAFSTWPLWPWYSYGYCLILLVLVGRSLLLSDSLWNAGQTRVAAFGLLTLFAWGSRGAWVLLSKPSLGPARPLVLSGPPGGRVVHSPSLSYNQASLVMARSLFADGRKHLVAMGDRAGGLAYWARSALSVVQLEGLLGDADFIRARAAGRGAEYLERLPIEYLVLDRESVPTTHDAERGLVYVVVDPIQGRVMTRLPPTFCFPARALRWQLTYNDTTVRRVFSFADRVPCTESDLGVVKAIANREGLRHYSLPTEYRYNRLLKPLEDLDRLPLQSR